MNEDPDRNPKIRELGQVEVTVYTLFQAEFGDEFEDNYESLVELSNLERVVRYGIGERSLNVQPGGIYQELIVDQYVENTSEKVQEEICSISSPVKMIGQLILEEFKKKESESISPEDKELHREFNHSFNDKNKRDKDGLKFTLKAFELIMKISPLLIKTSKPENVALDEDLQTKVKNLYKNEYPIELQERFQERG